MPRNERSLDHKCLWGTNTSLLHISFSERRKTERSQASSGNDIKGRRCDARGTNQRSGGGREKGNIKHALCRRFVEEESDTEEEERNQKNKKDHSRRSFCLHVWFHFVKICPTWCRLNLKEQLSSFTGDDIKGGILKSFWSVVMWDADAWSVTRPLLASPVLKTTERATWLPLGTEKVVVKKTLISSTFRIVLLFLF